MKCEFCNWNSRPENIPEIKRHINSNHLNLEDYWVAWRDRELVVTRNLLESDIDMTSETKYR